MRVYHQAPVLSLNQALRNNSALGEGFRQV
jgi:hypothetical protein